MTSLARKVNAARKADMFGRPVRISNQRVSDWRRGRNVPSNFVDLAVVLEVLIRMARPARAAEPVYDLKRWRALWEQAVRTPVKEPSRGEVVIEKTVWNRIQQAAERVGENPHEFVLRAALARAGREGPGSKSP
ncbi:hypothetical protein [Amycolatopsis vancoresmycina]|uniref:hypothetical protein n=1 Tax=Amycolatopsis vancoresmycina TaxID=208444 RepID=UPI0012DEE78E|nr:hypothetical protein [Amycolatopsis vancoresmycina]